MTPLFAQNFDEKVGRTIDDRGVTFEIRLRVDEATDLNAGHYPVEIAVERVVDTGKDVQGTKPRRLIALFKRDILPHDPGKMLHAVNPRDLPGNEEKVPGKPIRNVVA